MNELFQEISTIKISRSAQRWIFIVFVIFLLRLISSSISHTTDRSYEEIKKDQIRTEILENEAKNYQNLKDAILYLEVMNEKYN